MASKVTFLRLNGLLFASVALFVFVISDSESFNLDSQVRFWVTHNCTFPPRSLYEELDSILDPCFENDVEAELSLLCSSLFKFSNTLCTHKPKLGLKKYFTEESVDQKSNITNPCSFAQEYLIGDTYLRLQKYLGKIITNMTSCYRYCEAEESAFAKICKLFIAGATIYKESLVSIVNPGQNIHSPPPVMKGKLEPNETETQLGFDVENASLLNTTVKSDIPVASSIEKSTAPFSIDATPEIFSDTKPPTLQSSDVTNKIGPTITDSQPTSSQQEKTSLTYENQPPVKEIKTTVSILPAAEEQTLVPSNTQDTSTFITSTIGTTQPEYSDNQSEEKTEKKTSNENSVHAEHDEKSTETENQDDNYFDDDDDPRDTVKEDKNTEDDTHNKTQDNEDDSTKNENTEDDSHNKSKNVQGNSDEKDQNMELRPVLEDNQETDQDRDFIPKSGVNQKIEESNDDSSSSSHFMAYFVTALVLCIAGYVIYHNKQKIIAFFLEGRRNGRRRAALGNTKYSKLTPSVEEVMPSLETAASAKNFIY